MTVTATARIETSRLTLRPFALGDIDAYAAIRAKPEVVRFLSGGEAAAAQAHEIADRTVRACLAAWSDGPGYGPWAVVETSSGRLIGHLGLRWLPELGGETELLYLLYLLYLLDSAAWGRGYATEGALAALDYGSARSGWRG